MTTLVESGIQHLVEIRGIAKEYPDGDAMVTAIRHMDFFIDDGEFVTIMGQSGSGKSTLLAVLGGLCRPSRGRVLIDGLDLYRLSGEQRADFRSEYIGFVFQSFQLIPYLTVRENVKLPMAITSISEKRQEAMAVEVLEKVGLANKADRLPDQLSGGEQERVAIARAIVNRPPILLADEPTGNLDTNTSEEVMGVLTDLNREGLTVVMVTHNPAACRFSRRTIEIRDGEVVGEPAPPCAA